MVTAGMLAFLGVSVGLDIRRKEVSVAISVIFGMIAVICNLYTGAIPIPVWLSGVLPGIFLILAGWLTGGAIGTGDGIVMLVCGLFLGVWKALELLITALFISAFFSLALIVIKKAGKKDTIPFVPFIMAAYLVIMVLNR